CTIHSTHHSKTDISTRHLNEFDTFIRNNISVQIINKVRNKESKFLSEIISSRRPYGLDSKVRPTKTGELTLVWSGGSGPFPLEGVTNNAETIKKWKVLLSKASHDHGGQPDKDGKRR